ncbi:MAG: DUF262 domain-containing protein [Coriobacteriia bacterium]|nr:DUF262 domain-containing protein [Coriobacteriia bacterium]
MQTQQTTYLDFLGTPDARMAIPVFQRVYSWTEWQCEELWNDICAAGATGEAHFIGSIVYLSEDMPQADDGQPAQLFSIVDGQQRTVTMTLLFAALRDYLKATESTIAGVTAADVARCFLYVGPADAPVRKLIGAPADEETLAAVLNYTQLPEDYKVSKGVVDNYYFFLGKLQEGFDPEVLWTGLQLLFAIVVRLDETDNTQLIFEGLNSKGLPLSTSDLLRNRLFFGNTEAEQKHLVETYWEPLEALFANDEDLTIFDAALRCWLVAQDPSLKKCSRYELYSAFRNYLNNGYKGTTEELMAALLHHCDIFRKLMHSPKMKQHVEWAKGNALGGAHKIFG